MYIAAVVDSCDVTDLSYHTPQQGAYALARGATGRWCPVLAFGPEETAKIAHLLVPVEEARERIEAQGDWLDY